MAWGKAGSTTLEATGNNVTVSSLPNSKFGMAVGSLTSGGSSIRLNGVSSSNSYTVRRGANNSESTDVNLTSGYITDTINNPHFNVSFFCNVSGQEKLWFNHNVERNSSGAGNAPNRVEAVGKYVGTEVITGFTYFCWAGNSYISGDNALVLGSDMTPSAAVATKVQDGAVFHETDTNKAYVLYNDTWSEL